MRAGPFVVLCLVVVGCHGRSRTNCPDTVVAWARTCAQTEGVTVSPSVCPVGGVVLVAQSRGGRPLRVEVSRDPHRGFVHAGALGLSPVGEFPDWESAPATTRSAFDAVVRCAHRNPSLPIVPGTITPHPERPR